MSETLVAAVQHALARDPVLPRLRRTYRFSIGPHVTDEPQLNLVFSPSANFTLLKRHEFPGVTIHLVDRLSEYFIRDADRMLRLFRNIAERELDKIVLVGSSKGGFAALMFGTLLSQYFPQHSIEVRVFSPQVTLWPFNDVLPFPSYHRLIRGAEADTAIQANLIRFGDPTRRFSSVSNLKIKVAFGTGNQADQREADRLAPFDCVEMVPLDTSSHLSALPFIVDIRDRDQIEETLLRYITREKADADVASLRLNKDIQKTVGEFVRLGSEKERLDSFWAGTA
jgi:hypothetical protein